MVEELPRSGHPSMANIEENVEKLEDIAFENRYIRLRELASELNIVYGKSQHIVVAISGMRCVSSRFSRKI